MARSTYFEVLICGWCEEMVGRSTYKGVRSLVETYKHKTSDRAKGMGSDSQLIPAARGHRHRYLYFSNNQGEKKVKL